MTFPQQNLQGYKLFYSFCSDIDQPNQLIRDSQLILCDKLNVCTKYAGSIWNYNDVTLPMKYFDPIIISYNAGGVCVKSNQKSGYFSVTLYLTCDPRVNNIEFYNLSQFDITTCNSVLYASSLSGKF